ncbi:hypothetical protein ABPG72_022596 [Tetrahymena utriculariae]
MQDFNQNNLKQKIFQENGRNCFFVINIISILFTVSQLFSKNQAEGNMLSILLTLAYHGLNVFAAYNLSLLWIKVQKIVSICFGIIHSIAVLVMVFILFAILFGKSDHQVEENKLVGFIVFFCLTFLVFLILLIDILNYKYLNQVQISLENKDEQTASYFTNNQYFLNQQLINPYQNQQTNNVELKDLEKQNQRQP